VFVVHKLHNCKVTQNFKRTLKFFRQRVPLAKNQSCYIRTPQHNKNCPTVTVAQQTQES